MSDKKNIGLPSDCFSYDRSGEVLGLRFAEVVRFLVEGPYQACEVEGMRARRDLVSGRYVLGDRAIRSAVRCCYPQAGEKDLKEIMGYIADCGLPARCPSPAELVLFQNGVLDMGKVASGDGDCLRPVDEEDCFTTIVPRRYNPEAQCPDVDRFLDQLCCGDEATRTNLIETLSLALYRDHTYLQICAYLYGMTASNGKSTMMQVLQAVLGSDNCVALTPDDLVHEYKAAEVAGKLLVVMNDTPHDCWKSSVCSALKTLVDGSEKLGNRKFMHPFAYKSHAAVVMSSNELPKFPPSEMTGLMRRLHLIPMKAQFVPGAPGYEPDIVEKVTTREACEYWLKLAVRALVGILRRHGMTRNEEGERLAEQTVAGNDSFLDWINDEGIQENDLVGKINQEVYSRYKTWCSLSGCEPRSLNMFSRSVNAKFGLESGFKSVQGKNKRVYKKVLNLESSAEEGSKDMPGGSDGC